MDERRSDAALIGGRYRLLRPIGSGGMGVVHEAADEALGRKVAIKQLRSELAAAPEAFERLEREARAAVRVEHANIVNVIDVLREDAQIFVVMERLSGETLEERLERVGPLPIEVALRIHLQLLDALAAAHDAGVIHRDIKPSNVFLTELGDGSELVKLLDFGIAYLLEELDSPRLTASGIALGTPAYMAPERVRGELALDPRADLYSVAVCLYQTVTGTLPFSADTPMALHGRILLDAPPSLHERRPDLPVALSDIVQKSMSKAPDARFPEARHLATALREVMTPSERRSRTSTVPGIGSEARAALETGETMLPRPSTLPGLAAGARDTSETQETTSALPSRETPTKAGRVRAGHDHASAAPEERAERRARQATAVGAPDAWGGAKPPPDAVPDVIAPPSSDRVGERSAPTAGRRATAAGEEPHAEAGANLTEPANRRARREVAVIASAPPLAITKTPTRPGWWLAIGALVVLGVLGLAGLWLGASDSTTPSVEGDEEPDAQPGAAATATGTEPEAPNAGRLEDAPAPEGVAETPPDPPAPEPAAELPLRAPAPTRSFRVSPTRPARADPPSAPVPSAPPLPAGELLEPDWGGG